MAISGFEEYRPLGLHDVKLGHRSADGPGMVLTAVVTAIQLATVVWVWFDARGRDWSRDGFANSRLKWVIGVSLLWLIAFPLYLVRRRRAPLLAEATGA